MDGVHGSDVAKNAESSDKNKEKINPAMPIDGPTS